MLFVASGVVYVGIGTPSRVVSVCPNQLSQRAVKSIQGILRILGHGRYLTPEMVVTLRFDIKAVDYQGHSH